MVICKKYGAEFSETSENDIKESYKEDYKTIQKMTLKSLSKNLCSDCLNKRLNRLLFLSFGLFFCSGVFSIAMYIIYMDFLYLLWGATFIPLPILAYYFFVKKDILKLFAKKDSSKQNSK